MGKRRAFLSAMLFAGIILLGTGCGNPAGRTGKSGSETAVSGSSASGAAASGGNSALSGSSVEGESALAKKSRDFAEQIVTGLYAPLMEHLTAELASRTDEEKLRESFESVVGNASGYAGIDSVEESQYGEYRIVLVTLRYAYNQGRTIRFVYDKQEKIAGLWFNEAALKNKGQGEEGEEKEVTIGRDPYALKGKLLLPATEKPAPAVVLIPGRTDMDMDGNIGIGGNTPIKDLAEGLAARGIASLRYHKRGFQYKNSLPENAGIYDTLVEDAGYAVDFLYHTKEIDTSRIYLAAQGKAADYLPALVQRKEKRLAGVAMLAGKPIRTTETIYAEEKKTVQCDASYWVEKNSTLPLLVLQGESDFETPMTHYKKWQELLKGRSHVTYRSYRGLNHYFMPSAGKTDAAEYDKTGSVSASVIRDLADWLML